MGDLEALTFDEYRMGVEHVLAIQADNGHGKRAKLELYLRPGTMRVRQSCNGLLPGLGCAPEGTTTGKGIVTNLYKLAIAESLRRGLQFESDERVSESAAKVWDRLANHGYTIHKNPDAVFGLSVAGTVVWHTRDGSSVFKVTGKLAPIGL